MESTINERFVLMIEVVGKNPNSFAKTLGKGYTSIDSIVKGKTKPSFDLLEAVFDTYPQISPDWLMKGEGGMLRSSPSTTPPKEPVRDDAYLQEYMVRLENQFRSVLAEKQSIIEDMRSVILYQRELLGKSKRGPIRRFLSHYQSIQKMAA
jgi:hypothetical protein